MKELRIVLNGSEDITYELLMNELPYLKSVMHETLRLATIVPRNIKVVVDDDVLPDGSPVRQGDIIVFSNWCMGRNRRVWGEDAALFVPERWLLDDEDGSEDIAHAKAKNTPMHGQGTSPFGKFKMENQFKFNSFNAGPRLCLGQTFATLEAMLTTVLLLQRLEFQLVPEQKTPTYRNAATLMMKNPPLVVVKSIRH
ncbi:Protein kinase alk2 [Lunasporangiospora selenospora]|uniref:Protein kinase alk2 n=1 Tax=Lunasporangiospora selenospora TaxID=979761 RepID=A0A9P6KET8_9FUNG|nr:Protein kinase alk2 [Lunasporangiospora selenospora]